MRVLIVKLSSLGDLFGAMPAARLLRRHAGAALDWVTQPEYAGLVSRVRGVDRVIPYPRRDFFRAWRPLVADLRRTRYDLILDFQGLLKSALVCRLASGARRIAPSFSAEGSHLLMGERARPAGGGPRHFVDACLDTIRHLGLPVDAVKWGVDFPRFDPPGDAPRVALAPFSRWPAKNWALDRFRELARILLRETPGSIHWIGGAADRAACQQLRDELGPRAFNHAGAHALPETGGLLAAMDLLVTNDSGPMHMACAAGTRVLALFGPTDARRTGPYGEGHVVLQSPVFEPADADRSAYKRGGTRWMDAIPVGEAATAALALLSRPQ